MNERVNKRRKPSPATGATGGHACTMRSQYEVLGAVNGFAHHFGGLFLPADATGATASKRMCTTNTRY